jgi:phosphinothricin acetyltransferase
MLQHNYFITVFTLHPMIIRPALPSDAVAIATIYNHFVINTMITFEEDAVSASEIQRRIQAVVDNGLCWYVAELADSIVGYAYAAPWRVRSAYRYSVETTVYVAADYPARGIGSQLYQTMIDHLRDCGIHAVIGGITHPNPASVALHEKCGFKKVAHFEQVGYKFNQWIDVGYWELVL